mgnify:CR=1 FL=1
MPALLRSRAVSNRSMSLTQIPGLTLLHRGKVRVERLLPYMGLLVIAVDGWEPSGGKSRVHLRGDCLVDLALFLPPSVSPVHHPPLASDGERVFLGDVL